MLVLVPGAKPRYDPGSLFQGQGNSVIDLLPAPAPIEVRSSAPAARGRAVVAGNETGQADAVLWLLDRDHADRLLEALPAGVPWLRLLQRARAGDSPHTLVARLPGPRGTLAVVGMVKAATGAFARLECAARLLRQALEPGVRVLQVVPVGLGETAAGWLEAALSAALHAAVPLPQRKQSPRRPPLLERIELGGELPAAVIARALAVAEGNQLARWLTLLPPNVLDCVAYRKALQKLARREGWTFRFHDEAALDKLGAGAFLAVSRANPHRGAGIVQLSYRPPGRVRKRARPVALVGKGICFDTGGINLKNHSGMFGMHGDMQGSAVAVGTLLALTRLAWAEPVECWLALTENQIGPLAYRPQEVVTACNGVSIQVVHSDAEGRMVLADTLALAARGKPRLLLDYATLTGACVRALTERYSGAFTNRPALEGELVAAGRECGERVWCFPMDEDYDRDLDSPVADILQCAIEGKGDHILAARFLNRFVPTEQPWVHVDLAAAERKGGLGHVPSDATGFGVRYTVNLLATDGFLARAEAAR
jgi:leucyl aminopeptidase